MNFSSIPAVNGSNSNSGAADETRNPRPETAGFLIGQGTDQKVWAKDLGNRRAIHFFISAKLKFKKEAISQSYIKRRD